MRTRPVEMYVPIQDVEPGDLISGLTVVHPPSRSSDTQWVVRAGDEDPFTTHRPAILLVLPDDHPVSVVRRMPVADGKCIQCGKRPIKYANMELCNTCYANAYRQAKKAPEEDHFGAVIRMMPEHAREISDSPIRLVR